MAALFVPAFILLTGFLIPTADPDTAEAHYKGMRAVLGFPLVDLILLVIISLSFFHCFHRIRHTLMDLGWKSNAVVPLLYMTCYGGAVVGTIVAAYILFSI